MINNYSVTNAKKVFLNNEQTLSNKTVSERMVISEDILSNISSQTQKTQRVF